MEQQLRIFTAEGGVGDSYPVEDHHVIFPTRCAYSSKVNEFAQEVADFGHIALQAGVHGLVIRGIVVGLGRVAQGVGVTAGVVETQDVAVIVVQGILIKVIHSGGIATGGIHRALAAVVGGRIGT